VLQNKKSVKSGGKRFQEVEFNQISIEDEPSFLARYFYMFLRVHSGNYIFLYVMGSLPFACAAD